MVDDFFLGFAGHAHTMNELEINPEEAQKLTLKECMIFSFSLLSTIFQNLSNH